MPTIVKTEAANWKAVITVKRRNEGVVSRGHLLGRNILVKNYAQLKAGEAVFRRQARWPLCRPVAPKP
jgi:hypothetical protein